MYKICVVLGWPAIRIHLLNSYLVEVPELVARLRQHRIITSENLDKYYSEKAEQENLLDEYQGFMATMLESDSYTEIEDTNADLSKDLTYYLKKKNKEFVVAIGIENDFEISKSACRYQYTIEEAAADENGPFAMYSVKANFMRKQGENAFDCLEWLKNQLKYETEINIIDQYILSQERNYNCLIKHILPRIPLGSTLNIHTTEDALFKNQIVEEASKRNIIVNVYTYREMHDRYITTSDRCIGLPIGIDFMKEKDGRTVIRKTTTFTMTKKRNKQPYLEYERELAGRFIG